VTIPALTADQMREVDRLMIDELHIEVVQMMENAGRNLAELAIRLFAPRIATVLAGPGGNGGGGMAAARHLANRGVRVEIVLSHLEAGMAPAPRHQLDILRRMGLPVRQEPSAEQDLVLDALIGYSLNDPRDRAAELIEWANRQGKPILALDTPSGLDVTTGQAASPCIRASVTMTLALPKAGLLAARAWVGELFLADISVPPVVYRRLGIEVSGLFKKDTIVAVASE